MNEDLDQRVSTISIEETGSRMAYLAREGQKETVRARRIAHRGIETFSLANTCHVKEAAEIYQEFNRLDENARLDISQRRHYVATFLGKANLSVDMDTLNHF